MQLLVSAYINKHEKYPEALEAEFDAERLLLLRRHVDVGALRGARQPPRQFDERNGEADLPYRRLRFDPHHAFAVAVIDTTGRRHLSLRRAGRGESK